MDTSKSLLLQNATMVLAEYYNSLEKHWVTHMVSMNRLYQVAVVQHDLIAISLALVLTSKFLGASFNKAMVVFGFVHLVYQQLGIGESVLLFGGLLTVLILRTPFGKSRKEVSDGLANTTTSLYQGTVYHRRTKIPGVSPVENSFRYPVNMLYINVDETDKFPDDVFSGFLASFLWGVNKQRLVSWCREDYLGDPSTPLGKCVRELVERHTGSTPTGPIMLLTNPRYFGFAFNPVSVYYCFSADKVHLEAVVLEVSNTPWLEKRWYVLPGSSNAKGQVNFRWNKDFHVSPFMDMKHDYQWRIDLPGKGLHITAVNRAKLDGSEREPHGDWKHSTGETVVTEAVQEGATKGPISFIVGLHCDKVPFRGVGPLVCLMQQPFMTFLVVLWIHWQAVVVAVKGVTYKTPPSNSRALDLSDAFKHLVVFAVSGLYLLVSMVCRVFARFACVLPMVVAIYYQGIVSVMENR